MIGFALLFIGLNLLKGQMESVGAASSSRPSSPKEGARFERAVHVDWRHVDGIDSVILRRHRIDVGGHGFGTDRFGKCPGHGVGGKHRHDVDCQPGRSRRQPHSQARGPDSFLDQPVWGDVDDLAHPRRPKQRAWLCGCRDCGRVVPNTMARHFPNRSVPKPWLPTSMVAASDD